MADILGADHFVDLEEADERAGAYKIHYDRRGVAFEVTAHCPCGCGQIATMKLEPFGEEGEKTWNLSENDHGKLSLWPEVSFDRKDRSDLPHWDGWFLGENWIRKDSPLLQLANRRLKVVELDSSVRGEPVGAI